MDKMSISRPIQAMRDFVAAAGDGFFFGSPEECAAYANMQIVLKEYQEGLTPATECMGILADVPSQTADPYPRFDREVHTCGCCDYFVPPDVPDEPEGVCCVDPHMNTEPQTTGCPHHSALEAARAEWQRR